MSKTRIEWCDFSTNPVKGLCPVACSYCYARRMYKRFKWNPEIRYIGKEAFLNEILAIPRDKPAKIFVGSTFELFGDWVKDEWLKEIFEVAKLFPFFTFIFLTKRPERLRQFSPFPENCWVGVSMTGKEKQGYAYPLAAIKAGVKFLSCEPMLAPVTIHSSSLVMAEIDWLIIGQQTPVNKKTCPDIEWINELILSADEAQIPVFIKDNLNCCLISDYEHMTDSNGNLRQEFPSEKVKE